MRVIVTRPAQDAAAWVQALSERGHEVLALPLIEIAAASDPHPLRFAWQRLEAYQALMFVSGNAVAQFCAAQRPASLSAWAQRAPLTRAWATGPGTRRALLQAGVPAPQIDAPGSGQFDSEALWRLVQGSVRAGATVLIVRGSDAHQTSDTAASGVGRDWLAQRLLDAGAGVEFVVAYERRSPPWSAQQLEQAQRAAGDGSLWLFSSSEAIVNLQRLAPLADWRAAQALATHPRIAGAARDAGFGTVRECSASLAAVAASIESQA
jgi:uroporphyrinogen-III synthase